VRNALRVSVDRRLTVPRALRLLLGVDVHGHVLVQPVPGAGALCLVNRAAIFPGAPLGLLRCDSADAPSRARFRDAEPSRAIESNYDTTEFGAVCALPRPRVTRRLL
jgi:hypothetical protein